MPALSKIAVFRLRNRAFVSGQTSRRGLWVTRRSRSGRYGEPGAPSVPGSAMRRGPGPSGSFDLPVCRSRRPALRCAAPRTTPPAAPDAQRRVADARRVDTPAQCRRDAACHHFRHQAARFHVAVNFSAARGATCCDDILAALFASSSPLRSARYKEALPPIVFVHGNGDSARSAHHALALRATAGRASACSRWTPLSPGARDDAKPPGPDPAGTCELAAGGPNGCRKLTGAQR